MKKITLLSIIFLIMLAACKNVNSTEIINFTDDIGSQQATVPVESNPVQITSINTLHDADNETLTIEKSDVCESIIEVYPNTTDLPKEICDVFYEGKPFNFVFYEFRKCGDGFVNYRNSMSVCVKDFVYNLLKSELKDGSLDDDEYTVYWKEYTVIDLDDDGVNELVYLVDPGSGGYIIIFHVIDGEVYGYSEFLRDMEILYKDRVIMGESGAAWYRYERIISFNKEGYTIEELARAEQPYAEKLYYIGDEEVDEATFRDYTAQWGDKYCEMAVKWISADSE